MNAAWLARKGRSADVGLATFTISVWWRLCRQTRWDLPRRANAAVDLAVEIIVIECA